MSSRSALIRLAWRVSISLTLAITPVVLMASSAAANVDQGYENRIGNLTNDATDPWGFGARNCTSFVAYRMEQHHVTLHGVPFKDAWSAGIAGKWDHAKYWNLYAPKVGVTVDHTAAIGAIAQWTGGDHGHVAIVTNVRGTNIDVEEYNWESASNQYGDYQYGTRTNIPAADNYIHLERTLPGGMWNDSTPASGTISGSVNLSAHVEDNGNGGLDRAQITASESSDGHHWNSWHVIQPVSYGGLAAGSIGKTYSFPSGIVCARVSFDVFSLNNKSLGTQMQSRQYSPHGIRQYRASGASCDQIAAAYLFVDDDSLGGLGGGGGTSGTGQPSGSCVPGQNQTALFTDTNYQGACVVKDLGAYNDAAAVGLPDNSISSIKVGSGANVRLCDNPGLNSPCEFFNYDDPDLSNNTINTDTVSSVMVEGGQPTTNCVPGDREVALFVDPNYGGSCVVRGVGTYNDAAALMLPDNSISSIKVGAKAKARVCDNPGMNSPCEYFDYDDSDLSNNSINTNTISSVGVEYRGGISLCDGTNYGGPCKTFGPGLYNMSDYGFYDTAESVLYDDDWKGMYHLVLWSEANQTGNPAHYDSSSPDIGPAFRNHVRSIKIYKNDPPSAQTVAPANNTVFPGTTTSVGLDVTNGDTFRVHVWSTTYDYQSDWSTATHITLNGLTPGQYGWQVQSQGSAGQGPWSAISSFAINTAPVVVDGNVTMDVGTTQTVQVEGTDAEQSAVAMSASGLPGFAAFTDNHNGTATLALNPGAGAAGTYQITVNANDGELTGSGVVIVTVAPPASMTFENFESGIGAWWQHGNVSAQTTSGNTFVRLVTPAGGDVETSKDVNTAALASYDSVSLAINLHGATVLGNDASALYLDQGGWKYAPLANYLQQGFDGWQNLTVPLSDFTGFDKTTAFSRLGIRFWAPTVTTIDVDNISFGGTVTPPPAYQAQYFNNRTLSGTPVLTRSEPAIQNDWGMGSPDTSVNVDNFSARWTKTTDFAAGSYRVTATGDDGLRLYVDSQLLIDKWIDQAATTYTADVALSAGSHTIVYEYYEAGGGAVAKLSYAPAPGPAAIYQAQYFNNQSLSGTPVLTRNESAIANDWGGDSADPSVNSDHFSARWTTTTHFDAGSYTFVVVADDGVRLFVDGQLVIDEWIDQPASEYKTTLALAAGDHAVKMEYYENSGGAVAALYTAKANPGDYLAEYFNNRDLDGLPVLVRNEGAVNNDWGEGSPNPAVNVDNFSARWTKTDTLTAGVHQFSVTADDGARLYIDGNLVIDEWIDQGPTTYTTTQTLPAGPHTIVMEYYDNGWGAVASLTYS
jgi:surface antigen